MHLLKLPNRISTKLTCSDLERHGTGGCASNLKIPLLSKSTYHIVKVPTRGLKFSPTADRRSHITTKLYSFSTLWIRNHMRSTTPRCLPAPVFFKNSSLFSYVTWNSVRNHMRSSMLHCRHAPFLFFFLESWWSLSLWLLLWWLWLWLCLCFCFF